VAQNKVLTAPNFRPKNVGDLLASLPGQSDGLAQSIGNLLGGVVPSFIPTTGIVAHAGGGQASATPLTAKVNAVGTVATAADSVALPLAQAGLVVVVANATATSMQVFGSGTDTVNGAATGTGIAMAGNTAKTFYCTKSAPAGTWVG
jgi:hypothetical protein